MKEIISKQQDKICDYGCGQIAKYKFDNGKVCCSESQNSCPAKAERCGKAGIGKPHSFAKPIETNEICSFGCNQKANFIYKNGSYCCSYDWHKCPGKYEELSCRSTKIWSDLERRKKLSKTQRKDLFAVAIPVLVEDKKCSYCGEKANFWFKTNDKYCCCDRIERCPTVRNDLSNRTKELWKDNNFREKIINSQDYKDPKRGIKISESLKKYAKNNPDEYKERARKAAKTRGPMSDEKREIARQRLLNKTYIELYGEEKAKEIALKISIKLIGQKRKEPMSFNTRKIMSNKKKDHWQDPNSSYNTKEFRNKKSLEAKNKWKDPEYVRKIQNSLHKSPNKTELILIDIIKELKVNYEFVGDWSLNINGRNPDFVNYKDNKLIEFFGTYYHDTIVKQTREEHERDRIKYFSKSGYKTLVIWEDELQDIQKIKKKIMLFNVA